MRVGRVSAYLLLLLGAGAEKISGEDMGGMFLESRWRGRGKSTTGGCRLEVGFKGRKSHLLNAHGQKSPPCSAALAFSPIGNGRNLSFLFFLSFF